MLSAYRAITIVSLKQQHDDVCMLSMGISAGIQGFHVP